MITVELISVGTEILLGNIVNTNAAFLSEKCAAFGLSVYYQTTVGDNPERLEAAIRMAYERSDIVLITGGLGPTDDDITRETTAKVMGRELYKDQKVQESIIRYLENGPYDYIPENNYRQAYVPEGATILHNSNGTAPGLILENDSRTKAIILLPGPPSELKPMFEQQVVPYLKRRTAGTICSKMIKISEVGESRAAEMIQDLLDMQTNPTIAPYAKTAEVHLRITAFGKDEQEALQLIAPIEKEIYARFGDAIFTSEENVTLEDVVVALLRQNKYQVTTVESCTGGKIADKLVHVAGASEVFEKGYITYSDQAKTDLVGVDPVIIQKYGVVSREVAEEMAICGARSAGTQTALSVTGIAGPDGGTKRTPVGTVFIGCYVCGRTIVKEYHFSGNRENIRENAAVRALNLLRRTILVL